MQRPGAWEAFERGHISEQEYLTSFWKPGVDIPIDGAALTAAMVRVGELLE